jgi:hypothetical protein
MNLALRRLIMFGAPLVLGVLLITHPVVVSQFTPRTLAIYGLLPVADWWLTIHVLLLPLFFFIALAAFLLTQGVHGAAATISRVALGVFAICYPAFDTLIGISIGTLVRFAVGLAANQQSVVEQALDTFLHSPVAALFALLGELGWFVGILAAVLALSSRATSRLLVTILVFIAALFEAWSLLGELVAYLPLWMWWVGTIAISILLGLALRPHLMAGLLTMAAFLLSNSHIPPFGPLAMACFFLAVLQYEILRSKSASVESVAQPTLEVSG